MALTKRGISHTINFYLIKYLHCDVTKSEQRLKASLHWLTSLAANMIDDIFMTIYKAAIEIAVSDKRATKTPYFTHISVITDNFTATL